MVNANIDIFEMSYEESVSYFKRLENLEKIRRTNGPNPSSLPVDNCKCSIVKWIHHYEYFFIELILLWEKTWNDD
jgi:hypothetical protein